MSTIFLFGAGASAFSGECRPSPPPLGINLFDELRKLGGVAASIDGDLADEFHRDFEVGMRRFREARGAEATTFLLEMARYFAHFTPGLTNLYLQLFAAMSDMRQQFIIASLNYELMVELAVTEIGRTIQYAVSKKSDSVAVIKPHGSCNFLPDVAPRQFYNFSVNIVDTTRHSAILDAPVRIAEHTNEVIEFCDRENAVAPAMSLFEVGKDPLFCPSFIKEQQTRYKQAVAQAARVFVIGVRVNEEDQHIWLPLAACSSPLFYVGPDASDLKVWAAKHRRRGIHHFATSFQDAVPAIIAYHTRRRRGPRRSGI